MAGRNLFKQLREGTKTASSSQPCIFISHSSIDKPFAREVAETVIALGLNVYFDENDEALQNAVADSDDEKIVIAIEEGIGYCTHLLGVITKNTIGSWWVPFEIGSARSKNVECVHYVHSNYIGDIPSYIAIEKVITDPNLIMNWVRSISRERIELTERIRGIYEKL